MFNKKNSEKNNNYTRTILCIFYILSSFVLDRIPNRSCSSTSTKRTYLIYLFHCSRFFRYQYLNHLNVIVKVINPPLIIFLINVLTRLHAFTTNFENHSTQYNLGI